jgi:hypothetical protein
VNCTGGDFAKLAIFTFHPNIVLVQMRSSISMAALPAQHPTQAARLGTSHVAKVPDVNGLRIAMDHTSLAVPAIRGLSLGFAFASALRRNDPTGESDTRHSGTRTGGSPRLVSTKRGAMKELGCFGATGLSLALSTFFLSTPEVCAGLQYRVDRPKFHPSIHDGRIHQNCRDVQPRTNPSQPANGLSSINAYEGWYNLPNSLNENGP